MRRSSAPATQADLARGGKAPGTPRPLAWWQAAQLATNSFSPLAASGSNSTGPVAAVTLGALTSKAVEAKSPLLRVR